MSKSWFHVFQILALVGIAAAAFEFGILWNRGQTPAGPVEKPDAEKTSDTGSTNSIAIDTNRNPTAVSIRAEFNPQSALLLGVNELVRYQQSVFTSVVAAVHDRLPIIGIVNNEDEIELGQALLGEAGLPPTAIWFLKHPLDSMWLRDFGPLFTRWSNGQVEIVDSVYDNPDEYGARTRDDQFPSYIGKVMGMKVRQMPLVIEGGNLLSNGDGLMVTTTRVINRPENSKYTLQQIGQILKEYMGCRLWVYLKELEGEPTGHADFCILFLRRSLVLVGQMDPAVDPVNAAILDSMAETLRGQPTTLGPLKVERLYMPPRTAEGDWRSYCNVLICNGRILVPSYSDVPPEKEKLVHDTFKRLVPGIETVAINCDSLIKKRGVLHCIGITVPGYVNINSLLGESIQ